MTNPPYTGRLRTLLDRYYAAATSPAEENELRSLLASPDLPEEFREDREMMAHLTSVLPPDGFEERLAAGIDSLAASEGDTAGKRLRFSRPMLWGAAASLLIGLGFGLSAILRPHPLQGSDLTPEETYAQTRMALLTFSEALNLGYDGLEQAEITTENATQKAMEMLTLIASDTSTEQQAGLTSK